MLCLRLADNKYGLMALWLLIPGLKECLLRILLTCKPVKKAYLHTGSWFPADSDCCLWCS